jgi:succinyl-CoA synthetase beta subunit
MNLHEYQAKEILKKYGVRIPEHILVEKPEDAIKAAEEITMKTGSKFWAVKAQIHAGGRGKGGGIKIAKSLDEVKAHTQNIIGMTLITKQTGPEGKLVNKVIIQQDIYYPGPNVTKEFYISILLNRSNSRNTIIYSTEGGMEIEEVAEKTPHLIFKEEINPVTGLQANQCRKIAFNLGLSGESFKEMVSFIQSLYTAYEAIDASMVEINPVLKATDDKIFAVDCKIVLEDNALFRHPEFVALRDLSEEDPLEVKARESHLNYIRLDGNVGCMVNGAGLAMATMDIIKLSGGLPANFLDVGGSASAKTVEAGFRIIIDDPNVKIIFVNIFGGIVRCDRVAEGIIEASKNIPDLKIPIIVRLQGTNATEAKQLIDSSGLKVYSAIHLDEAAKLVNKLLG